MGSTMWLICAVTVSAAGDILRPFIVFKGKHNGRIAHEFQNPEKSGFPVDCSYICQDRAWMDEAVMLQWVKEVLEPWSNNRILPKSQILVSCSHMTCSLYNVHYI